MKKIITPIIALFMVCAMKAQTNVDILPTPQHITTSQKSIKIPSKVQIVLDGALQSEATELTEILKQFGISTTTKKEKTKINLSIDNTITKPDNYTLTVSPNNITIVGGSTEGVFYGIQSLRQLFELNNKDNKNIVIPEVSIQDGSAFEWRGSHLDVSRHMFTVDYIKNHIDRLSAYKMNKLHLHLTDDQGWRIEIKKYPKLTSEGAYRQFNNHDKEVIKLSENNPDYKIDERFIQQTPDGPIYGGYFTQEQLKDIIDYAAKKHIEIIPEIDMPGHMMAAIQAYPELIEGEAGWGEIFSVPLCVCKEEVYNFTTGILEEVIDLFPSQYIHIGADEVDKTTWKDSELCKELMARENIKDVNELQSYFVHKMQDFVESKGKKIIAWDEALEGGANPNVDIMFWRGWVPNAPQKATNNGNRVIMTPNNPLYFDYHPNKGTLRSVYNMQVIPNNIAPENEHLIRGAQANLWAETIPSEGRADFLLFPRLIALADRVWSNGSDFDEFNNKLNNHFAIFDKMGIGYRMPDICGIVMESVYVDKAVFKLNSPIKGGKIHYTTNGEVPSKKSPVLSADGFEIDKPTTLKVALFGEGDGKGDIYTINYKPTTFARPILTRQAFYPGLSCEYFPLKIEKTTQITGQPTETTITDNLVVPPFATAPQFGLKYNGYIEVPETGIYSFYLTCDDSGMLYIAEQLVIDNEGPHSPVEKSGQVALQKGLHPFKLDFVEAGGGYTLLLQYSFGDDCQPKDIPNSWFKH